MRWAGLMIALLACRNADKAGGDTAGDVVDATTDADGDGWDAEDDCDDDNAAVNPGAPELCDGVDNDCDGATDGADATDAGWYFTDADGDGAGDPTTGVVACAPDSDQVDVGDDCDDSSAARAPGATEICDEIDNNCDGQIDEGVTTTWYADADGDGFGDGDVAIEACTGPDGFVGNDDDCLDTAAQAWPGAEEVCDEIDNDCDGDIDEGVALLWYADGDGDGFGVAEDTTDACTQPTGYSADVGDCDDADDQVSPTATELCDEIDNDCDGDIDEDDAADAATFYADADADGYADTAVSVQACAAPSGTIAVSAGDEIDCDDSASGVHPGASERCDAVDNDCDGSVDEDDATDASTWYIDHDGDGYGDPAVSTSACAQPSGTSPAWVADATDCDDLAATANPAGTEVCDGLDNDCDGSTDGSDASDLATWYADSDTDGFGDPTASSLACDQPSGSVADATDCDDGDTAVNPDAEELCDSVDNDCDGDVDEDDATDADTWYLDADEDGYGLASRSATACDEPAGYVDDATDCDDLDADANPAATEVCDGADNDCDGDTDEGLLGTDWTCPSESCADVLADQPAAVDGDYWLSPDGGAPSTWACDMVTDGGGWTLVSTFDRENNGDSLADFESELTELTNDMGLWSDDETEFLEWNDYDLNSDAMAFEKDIIVPNDGEVRMDTHFVGSSMECSSVWFYVEDDAGAETDLFCAIDHECHESSHGSDDYDADDLSWVPGYTCANSSASTFTWDEEVQESATSEITAFHLRSLMWDSNGDFGRLYSYSVWVR